MILTELRERSRRIKSPTEATPLQLSASKAKTYFAQEKFLNQSAEKLAGLRRSYSSEFTQESFYQGLKDALNGSLPTAEWGEQGEVIFSFLAANKQEMQARENNIHKSAYKISGPEAYFLTNKVIWKMQHSDDSEKVKLLALNGGEDINVFEETKKLNTSFKLSAIASLSSLVLNAVTGIAGAFGSMARAEPKEMALYLSTSYGLNLFSNVILAKSHNDLLNQPDIGTCSNVFAKIFHSIKKASSPTDIKGLQNEVIKGTLYSNIFTETLPLLLGALSPAAIFTSNLTQTGYNFTLTGINKLWLHKSRTNHYK